MFWFFTRAFFGDGDGQNEWNAAALVTLVAVGFGRPAPIAQTLYYVGSLALVRELHRVLRIMAHRSDRRGATPIAPLAKQGRASDWEPRADVHDGPEQ